MNQNIELLVNEILREADKFATYLLMPENFVREEFTKLPVWLPAEMKLNSLAKKFFVSKKKP